MTVLLSIVLLVNAAFAFTVWPTFYKRVSRDPRARDDAGSATKFLRVHQILIGTAFVIATVSAAVAVIALIAG